jgi:uncharacterized membrane protein YfhO
MKSSKKSEIFKYFVPPLITVAVILIIYAVKGQYPFGTGTLIDNDWGVADFPALVRFWDVAHGEESVLFDWSTGLGLPKNAIIHFFYPVNYMLLFFKRDFLYEAMNYFFIAHMATISVTSFAFFRNVFKKLPVYFTYLFSLAFTFCGFNLQYYTNIGWLSAVAVFPLVALACYRLLNGKSIVFYTLILAYTLIVSTYFSFFILEGIVLISTLYIFCFLDKTDRKGAAFRLGTGTALSFVISLWAVTEFAVSTASSTRVQNDVGSGVLAHFIDILKTENEINSYKLLMLIGTEIGLVSLALILIKCRNDKKKGIFFLAGFVLFTLPIVFENIDLILNGGSYHFYVMRNGFLVAFFLFITAAYYYSKYDTTDAKEKNKVIAYSKLIICVLAFYVIVPLHITLTNIYASRSALSDNGKMLGLSMLYSAGIVFLTIIAVIIIIELIRNRKLRTLLVCVLVAFTVFVDSYRLIGARDSKELSVTEYSITNTTSLREYVNDENVFNRISNPSSELLFNYAVMLDRVSVSDWSHIVNDDFRQTFYRLGFGMMFTSVSDSGSTAFAKALLNIKTSVSSLDCNPDLYGIKQNCENSFTVYNNRYTLPLGVTFNRGIFDLDFNGEFFEYHNSIFENLTNGKEPLFKQLQKTSGDINQYVGKLPNYLDKTFEMKKDMYKVVYTYHADEKCILYFYIDDGSDVSHDYINFNDCTISVNGKGVVIPTCASLTNDKYRKDNNNNILELGTFENEDVTIELNSTHPEIDKPMVYAMSLAKLGELCDNYKTCVTEYSTGKKSMQIKAKGEDGKYLFIPVYNNGSWVCTVNGEKTEVLDVLGSFMAVPLKDGENDIRINYVPQRFYILIAFSTAALIVFVAALLIIRKKQLKAPEKLQTLFLWALTGLFSAFIAIAYIIPIIASIYYAFTGRG